MSRKSQSPHGARPYMKRALTDDDLQRNVVRAFNAARKVYRDLNGESPQSMARQAATPGSDVQQDLDDAVQNLSEAMLRMSGREPSGGSRRADRRRSWVPFAVAAGAAFVFFNPATGRSTRKWLKDHLFGSEEEFDYQPPNLG